MSPQVGFAAYEHVPFASFFILIMLLYLVLPGQLLHCHGGTALFKSTQYNFVEGRIWYKPTFPCRKSRPRSFLETGFRPLCPSLVWFVPLSRTKSAFWISTRKPILSELVSILVDRFEPRLIPRNFSCGVSSLCRKHMLYRSWPAHVELFQISPHPRYHNAPDFTPLQTSPRARFHPAPGFTLLQISPCPRVHPSPDSMGTQVPHSARLEVPPDQLSVQIQRPTRIVTRPDSLPAQRVSRQTD